LFLSGRESNPNNPSGVGELVDLSVDEEKRSFYGHPLNFFSFFRNSWGDREYGIIQTR